MGNKTPAPLCRAEKIVCNERSYCPTNGNVAAIDFGTTSVSLAYATKGYENIQTFPLGTTQSTRVLNVVLLKKEGSSTKVSSFGENARQTFLKQVKQDDYKSYVYFERIKMSLKREQAINRETLIESFSGEKYYLVEVIAFILQYLKDQLIDHLSRTVTPLGTTDFYWVITVPAIWDARGKRMMREAAYMAGLLTKSGGIENFTPICDGPLPPPKEVNSEKLSLALEPEAAALYSQKNVVEQIQADKSQAAIKCPTEYMVIDIGGGTVDITAHIEVEGNIKVPVIPTGNAWGGTQVNEAFSKMLQKLVDDPGYLKYLDIGSHSMQMASINDILYREFEDQKISYGNRTSKSIVVSLPNKFAKCYNETIELKVKEMHGVEYDDDKIYIEDEEVIEAQLFGPAIDGIIDCVLKAIEDTKNRFTTFYLVGGFGGCKYTHQKVEEAIKKRNSKAKVILPPSPRLAVAQGAVLWRQNPGKVTERTCDATYGISTTLPFDPKEHDEDYKYYDGEEKQDRCHSVFCVFIEKEEVANENEVITINGEPPSQNSTQLPIDIYCAPDRGVQYINSKDGKSNADKIGQLVIDIPNPDNLPLNERTVEITMDFSGTEIQAKAKYCVTGEEVKTTCDFLSTQ